MLKEKIEELLDLEVQERYLKQLKNDIKKEIESYFHSKEEGTETKEIEGYSVSVSKKINRKLDYKAYKSIEDGIPEGLRCVVLKPSIDLKKLRALEMVDPTISGTFITTSPAASSIKIKEVENGN